MKIKSTLFGRNALHFVKRERQVVGSTRNVGQTRNDQNKFFTCLGESPCITGPLWEGIQILVVTFWQLNQKLNKKLGPSVATKERLRTSGKSSARGLVSECLIKHGHSPNLDVPLPNRSKPRSACRLCYNKNVRPPWNWCAKALVPSFVRNRIGKL